MLESVSCTCDNADHDDFVSEHGKAFLSRAEVRDRQRKRHFSAGDDVARVGTPSPCCRKAERRPFGMLSPT